MAIHVRPGRETRSDLVTHGNHAVVERRSVPDYGTTTVEQPMFRLSKVATMHT